MNYIQRMRNLREDHDKTQQNIADILPCMHAMNVVQMSCPFITSLHSVIIIMYPQTIFLDYQITRDSKKNHLLRAIVTGNFVDILFFITYSVIGNRKTRYVLPESFQTRLFGHASERTLKNMYSRSLSK